MKKNYISPKAMYILLNEEDIIRTSGPEENLKDLIVGGDQLPD